MAKPNELRITIGEEKVLYISTLSDLGGNMLKLDFPMGEYELHPFKKGYYLGVRDYSPENEDVIQVFNDRDGHKGLAGTYYGGETDNVHLVRIFNQYISDHLPDEWWQYESSEFETDESEINEFETDESEINEFETDESKVYGSEMDESIIDELKPNVSKTDESELYVSKMYDFSYDYKRGKVKLLKCYNNIPVVFYLIKPINVDDLSNIELHSIDAINDCGNIDVCWYVFHSTEGRIGIAVKQKQFYDMMGDQAGLGLFSSNGCRAVGNFDYYNINSSNDKTDFDENVFYPDHTYECEYNPCNCDFEYESAKQRRIYWKNLLKKKGYLVK